MKENVEIYQDILNYLYLTLSKTAGVIPFSGRFWLEEITRGVGEQVLSKYGGGLVPESRRPVDICKSYIDILDREGFVDKKTYQLEEEEEDILVTINRSCCIYRNFCQGAEKEGLLFSCPRLGSLQAALKRILGLAYSTSVRIDDKADKCFGRIFPVKHRLKTETIRREGDLLTIAGDRGALFSRELFASILVAIKKYAPYILKAVLYDAGYRSSLTIAEHVKGCYSTPSESLTACFEEFKNAGFGKVELIFLDPDVGHAIIRCYNSFEVAVVKEDLKLYRTPRVICDLLRGKLSAYLTVILGRPMLCEEIKCASKEGEFCEFHAYPDEQESQTGSEMFV